eukprot:jgi/Chrzof1/4972/Cz15g07010.t1
MDPLDWADFSAQEPYQLERNLTITSDPPEHILNYHYLQLKCVICPGCSVTYKRMYLAQVRNASGILLDFYMYSPGGVIAYEDSGVIRDACVPARMETSVAATIPRPPGFPGNQSATLKPSYCVRGTCFNNTICYNDYAILSSTSPEQTVQGGYSLVMHNFTKLCRQFVALSCVEQRGADPCVQQAIDDINGFHKSQPAGSNTVVVMVVPAIIAGVSFVGFVTMAVWLWKRRHPRIPLVAGGKDGSWKDEPPNSAPRGTPAQIPDSSTGWQIMAYRTAEHFERSSGTNSIQLGLLLGAGSYGRVYRGRSGAVMV